MTSSSTHHTGSRRRIRARFVGGGVLVAGLVAASTLSASAAPVHATMTGEASGISATLGLLGNPPATVLSGLPDTGLVVTNATTTTAPACIDVPTGLLVVKALCASVATHSYTSRVTAQATVADLSVTVPGLPVIELRGVKAWSTITCGTSRGTTTIAFLKVGGKSLISRTETFSNGATLTVGPVKIVIDQTTRTGPPSRSRLVYAVHITANVPKIADLDVIVSSAYAKDTDCAPTAP
jgi:hypothetical protein